MIGYATATGSRRNVAAMRDHGWRVLMTPDTSIKGCHPHGMRWACDNGAWGAFQRGEDFPVDRFQRMRAKWAEGADWIVLPDIVAGGLRSLDFSLSWKPRITVPRLRLIAVQDGMSPQDVAPHLGDNCGIFVGGSTEWKLETMRTWGELSRSLGVYLHVARVNTVKRIVRCQDVGAHSFDGTNPTRFACNTPRLSAALLQGHLWGDRG